MVALINKDYDIGRVDSNVPINIVEEQIYDSLTYNFYRNYGNLRNFRNVFH